MSNIINFNKQKKIKLKADNEKQAEQNRVKFGRTKHEKIVEKNRLKKIDKLLNAHKLETPQDKVPPIKK